MYTEVARWWAKAWRNFQRESLDESEPANCHSAFVLETLLLSLFTLYFYFLLRVFVSTLRNRTPIESIVSFLFYRRDNVTKGMENLDKVNILSEQFLNWKFLVIFQF